jgi:hypothetical protein
MKQPFTRPFYFLVFACECYVGLAHAQSPYVFRTGLIPAANAPAASPTAPVVIPLSQGINPVTAGSIRLFSSQYRGQRTATASTNYHLISLAPTAPVGQAAAFRAGETVLVTVPAAVQSSGGAGAVPYVYQFTAATSAAPGTFSDAVAVPVGATPHSLSLGDVDGDGDLDLLTANTGGNTVSVRRNDGHGAYSGLAEVLVGKGPYKVVLADVDGDSDLDLLTVNTGVATVSVRLNDGSGNFSGGSDPVQGTSAYTLAVGDVDADGDLDFVVSTNIGYSIAVYFNNGAGTFSRVLQPQDLDGAQALVLADVDGDGDLDLLGTSPDNNRVQIGFNNGTGRFGGVGASTWFTVGRVPWSLAVADVDADGDLDVLTGNSEGKSASVRLNNGRGGFSGGSEVAVGQAPWSVTMGDINGDGFPDLLTTNGYDNTVTVSLNDGQGAFNSGAVLPVTINPWASAVGDVDGDGDLDLLTCSHGFNTPLGSVDVRLNKELMGVGSSPHVPVFPNPAQRSEVVWVSVPAATGLGEAHAEVFTLMGQRVLNETLLPVPGKNARALPVLALMPGQYYIRVTSAGGDFTQGLTVQ